MELLGLGSQGINAQPVQLQDPVGAILGGYSRGADQNQQQAIQQQHQDTQKLIARSQRNQDDMNTLKWLLSMPRDVAAPIGQALIANREADGFRTDPSLIDFVTSSKPADRETAVKAFDEVMANPNAIEKTDPKQLMYVGLQIARQRQASDVLAENGPALTPAAPGTSSDRLSGAYGSQVPAPTAQVGSPPAPALGPSSQGQPASPSPEQHASRQQILLADVQAKIQVFQQLKAQLDAVAWPDTAVAARQKQADAILKDLATQREQLMKTAEVGPYGNMFPATGETVGGVPTTSGPLPQAPAGQQWGTTIDAYGRATNKTENIPEQEKDVREVLAANNWADTAENRQKARAIIAARAPAIKFDINNPKASDASVDQIAQTMLANGGVFPPGWGRLPTVQKNQIMDRYTDLVNAAGLTPQGQQARADMVKANRSELVRTQTQRGTLMPFINTFDTTADLALKASDQWTRTSYPVINALLAKGATTWTGSKEYAQFYAYVNTVVGEYSKIMAGSNGQSTDTLRAHALAMLNTAQSPETFRSVIQALKNDTQARIKGFDDYINTLNTRISGGTNTGPAPSGGPPASNITVKWGRDAQGNPVPLP